ncbi:FHA domain protein [Gimesia chilikensis]|uniref:FHA domain protein n=1 Tax=Gimesia chilikensis TaxID=2605989 RepID=A0A517WMH5_9PLAN|nr:FHA domain-containing protein [Gimesia chilikensis]QDU06445.1 FHA domain protein [Gimesia chilikensis]
MLGELNPCGGGDPIPLLSEVLLVGRRSKCDITLQFPNVSSHHCQLEFINGYWRIRDMNSRNGIKVNGQRCDMKWLLPGDKVAIAKHEYEINYTPQSDEPPPEEENPFEMSLMEKAGLVKPERRPERPMAPPARTPKKIELPDDESKMTDDELGLKFLTDPDDNQEDAS